MLQELSYRKFHEIYLIYLITANPCFVKKNLNSLPYIPTPQNGINEKNLLY